MSTILTLVGTKQAKTGSIFLHCGVVENCMECKLIKVCQKLEPGRVYEVTKSRGIVHQCDLHEGGVTLVEVKEAPILALLDSRSCFPGSSITYKPKKCAHLECDKAKDCNPLGLHEGDKCRIEEVVERLSGKCENNEQLTLCKLRRVTAT
ncbi:MAG: UPF0179 family protein [Promethearchaeati archaeon SRVP18_Atabeyarchaeia-1]